MIRKLCLRSSLVGTRGCLVATMLWLTWVCSVLGVGGGASTRILPCPDENIIAPCVCTPYDDFTMDMDCSAVTGSNQLAMIFNQNFPFLDFNNLFITGNKHITSIRVGDLGDATFRTINITGGTLESVVHGALANSYDTLVTLDLSNNHVTDLPFDEISSFTKIDGINLRFNALDTFPDIHSTTLRNFQIGNNPLRTLSASALKNLPNLEEIGLHVTELSSVEPGTFIGIPMLRTIHLEGNFLTTLRANTIQVTGTRNNVHLNSNRLANIEVNAISGANYEVWIQNNELPELNEAVWRQMFDDEIRLSASGNPFVCGCDMAWIVLNAYYLENLMDDPTCSSGTLITNLDPAIFSELCT